MKVNQGPAGDRACKRGFTKQRKGSITKRFLEIIDAVLKVFELANEDLQSYTPTFSVAVLLSQNLHRVRTKDSNKATPSP